MFLRGEKAGALTICSNLLLPSFYFTPLALHRLLKIFLVLYKKVLAVTSSNLIPCLLIPTVYLNSFKKTALIILPTIRGPDAG